MQDHLHRVLDPAEPWKYRLELICCWDQKKVEHFSLWWFDPEPEFCYSLEVGKMKIVKFELVEPLENVYILVYSRSKPSEARS
jgi:hypothetical protein